jgi:hypothetical protein
MPSQEKFRTVHFDKNNVYSLFIIKHDFHRTVEESVEDIEVGLVVLLINLIVYTLQLST